MSIEIQKHTRAYLRGYMCGIEWAKSEDGDMYADAEGVEDLQTYVEEITGHGGDWEAYCGIDRASHTSLAAEVAAAISGGEIDADADDEVGLFWESTGLSEGDTRRPEAIRGFVDGALGVEITSD